MICLKLQSFVSTACCSLGVLTACAWAQSAGEIALMPVPAKLTRGPGEFRIEQTFTAGATGPGSTDARVKASLSAALYNLFRETGIPVSQQIANGGTAPSLLIEVKRANRGIQKLSDDESYHLAVTPQGVKLSSAEPLGAIRGLETFLQLVRIGPDGFAAPAVDITDAPRFPWRGLSLDVSRHFMPVEVIRRTLDGLAAVKLNVLHWHLSDDQGFRVESKRYPLLQSKGSDGLYYTQAEVREVIEYARNRGIRIVPEFDIPGHATAWYAGYPQLASGKGPYEIVREPGVLAATMDPTKESTYVFLDGLIGEMAHLFPDAYFHIGGDEVDPKGEWANNAHISAFMRRNNLKDLDALQAYFNRRVLKIVTKYGKKMEGWDEILQPTLPKNIVIQSWRGQKSLAQAAREGYQGLLSAGYYLDLMQPAARHYAVDPLKGDTAGLTAQQKKLILGGEAAMWVELATMEIIDIKLWPRLAAIAERLWSPESVTDVHSMYERLEITSRWLEFQGLQHSAELQLMQTRLAGSLPVQPLSVLASVLEPIQGYKRHTIQKYSSLTSYNRLIDAITPESDADRKFNEAVDRFVASPDSAAVDKDYVRRQLTIWKANQAEVLPVLQSNALLTENIDVANAVGDLAGIGLSAMDQIASGKSAEQGWVQAQQTSMDADAKASRELLISFGSGVRKLVDRASH